jgi:hypothetical protein
MTFKDLNLNPTDRQMRQFAVIWLAGFGLFGLLVAWRAGALHSGVAVGWASPWKAPLALWAVALAGSLVGLASPAALRPVYVAWMVLAFPIGWTISLLVLGLTYFVVFSGFGLFFRAIGRDLLGRTFDRDAPTYWVTRRGPREIADYFRQF